MPVLLTASLTLLASAVTAPAVSAPLDELMDALAARGPVVARFEEERHVSFLEEPLRSWGTMSFTPPDVLIRQTLGPEPSLARITGDQLLIADRSGERHLSLDTHPVLRAYVTPFRALLGGNTVALERHYEITADFSGSGWSLVLRPRDPRVAERIDRISVAGSGDRVEEIEIHERGSDWTRLQLSEAGR